MMKSEYLSIFFWRDKAYLPETGKTEVGIFWEMEHVHVVNQEITALSSIVESLSNRGNPIIPHPTRAEFRKLTSIQKELGFRSWKRMAQEGVIVCVVYCTDAFIGVAFSPTDAKDIQLVDYPNQREFPLDTEISRICKYILSELRARQKLSAN